MAHSRLSWSATSVSLSRSRPCLPLISQPEHAGSVDRGPSISQAVDVVHIGPTESFYSSPAYMLGLILKIVLWLY